MSSESRSPIMKNGLSDPAIRRLARCLKRGYPELNERAFRQDCNRDLAKLELKARVQHIIAQLVQHLPKDFEQARACVLRTAGQWDPGDPDDPLRGFAAWPLIDWVAEAGLDHPQSALATLAALTPLFSAEFAIRPFLEQHPKLTLQALRQWTKDSNPHVRRLVSEGTRPRLPWGPQLGAFVRDPRPCLPLLNALKDDPSESVRRSVANHLNDISKDNPEIAIELCQRWAKRANPARTKLLKHALRTLVKQGSPAALQILGFTTNAKVNASLNLSRKRLPLGDKQEMSFEITSTSDKSQLLVVDYAIDYRKANGKSSKKVFKCKTVELASGQSVTLQKQQTFKNFSTRKHYPGLHRVELQISGSAVAWEEFELLV